MKYVCLVYQEEAMPDARAENVGDTLTGEALDVQEELRQCGCLIASSLLQPARAATTVRMRNGKVTVWDGPFAEANDQLGEIYFIEARDLNEAIRIAAKMPSARLSSVEVRPLRD